MSIKSLYPTGKEIKKALIDLDLSYMDLARAMGCSIYYIREIAADTRMASDMRKRIAAHLASIYRKYNYKLPTWAKEIAA